MARVASWNELGPPRAWAMANPKSSPPARRAPERSGARDYRILFEKNLAGVYRTSLDGRILDCNDAFARIFGFNTRSEALAMTAQDLYPSAAEREASVRRLQAQGWLANAEECLRRRDGEPAGGAVASGPAVDAPRGSRRPRAPPPLRRPGQPRLVRRPDRLPAPVRPGPLARRVAKSACSSGEPSSPSTSTSSKKSRSSDRSSGSSNR